MSRLLRELNSQPPFALLDVLRAYLKRTVDTTAVGVWLADYAEQELRPLTLDRRASSEPVDVQLDGRLQQAFLEQRVTNALVDDRIRVFVPITQRAERLGILDLAMEAPPTPAVISVLQESAVVVAYVLVASRRYTDVFERARRRTELAVPAEVQWELLPVLAHDGPDFSIAGSLEPAYDIGGDNFDYAVEPDALLVSVTDAMGHGTAAALLCSLCVASQRNARRKGEGVRQQARAANLAVHDQYGGDAYLTQLSLRIERDAGHATAVNAGHWLPYLMRGEAVELVSIPPDVPLGLWSDSDFHVHELDFAPGDRLLLITDGMVEASSQDGDAFGEERLIELLQATGRERPSEVVRKLTRAVVEHRATTLDDDATAVCVDYRRR